MSARIKKDIYHLIGRTLVERFRIDSFVDEGGMGIVYQGTDIERSKVVAIKILHPRFANRPEQMAPYLKAFEAEGSILRQLRHNNIVRVYDVGTDEDLTFIAMEWLNGRTLEQRIHTEGRLPLEEVSSIVTQIASALDYAHGRKIVHLDIKPANIFLIESDEEYEHVKVIDFGLARIIQSTLGQTLSRVVGTPQYMAPEIFKNQASSLSDVYGLGVVTYQMVSGTLPFSTSQIYALMNAHLTTPPPSARKSCTELTRYNDELISLALRKDPIDRPQSAGMFATHFERGLKETGPLIEVEARPVVKKNVVYLDNPFVGDANKSQINSLFSILVLLAPIISIFIWYLGYDYGRLGVTELTIIYVISAGFAGYKLTVKADRFSQISLPFQVLGFLILAVPAILVSILGFIVLVIYLFAAWIGGKLYSKHRARTINETVARPSLDRDA